MDVSAVNCTVYIFLQINNLAVLYLNRILFRNHFCITIIREKELYK